MLDGMLRAAALDLELGQVELALCVPVQQATLKRSGESEPATVVILEEVFGMLCDGDGIGRWSTSKAEAVREELALEC